MRVAVGIASIAAAGLIIAGCTFIVHTTSMSIFNAGPGSSAGNWWFAMEPIVVAALGIAGGVLLMTVGPGRFRLVVAGTLIAFGIQTRLLFLGYALGLSYGGNREGVGGPLGMVGATCWRAPARWPRPAGRPALITPLQFCADRCLLAEATAL